ncbi:putative glycosyltransferase EpsF [invertebrate metagenome]|uniref:Putative glycosyltransferase EpsF n=1 Tax=invertebrate metagenome TaxID=1711999 RepID=A0A2H9T659_9ZZZZ
MAKILNILFSNQCDHAAVIYLHKKIAQHLSVHDGYEVSHLVFLGDETGLSVSDNQKSVKYMNADKRSAKGKSWIKGVLFRHNINKIIANGKFDCIICDGFGVLSQLNKNISIPVIVIIHGKASPKNKKRMIRLIGSLNVTLVAVSSVVHKHLSLLSITEEEKIKTISNSVDFKELQNSFYKKNEARLRLGLSNDDFVIGTVGRQVKCKRHDTIIQSLGWLKEHDRLPEKIKLVIIGDGECYEKNRILANEVGVNNNVVFLGAIENAGRYLQAFDLYVMASSTEGMSISLFESIAAKIPVIVSDCDAFEIVVSDKNVFFKVGDYANLGGKIHEYANCLEKRKSSQEIIYAYAKEHFDVGDFLNSYSDTISSSLLDK